MIPRICTPTGALWALAFGLGGCGWLVEGLELQRCIYRDLRRTETHGSGTTTYPNNASHRTAAPKEAQQRLAGRAGLRVGEVGPPLWRGAPCTIQDVNCPNAQALQARTAHMAAVARRERNGGATKDDWSARESGASMCSAHPVLDERPLRCMACMMAWHPLHTNGQTRPSLLACLFLGSGGVDRRRAGLAMHTSAAWRGFGVDLAGVWDGLAEFVSDAWGGLGRAGPGWPGWDGVVFFGFSWCAGFKQAGVGLDGWSGSGVEWTGLQLDRSRSEDIGLVWRILDWTGRVVRIVRIVLIEHTVPVRNKNGQQWMEANAICNLVFSLHSGLHGSELSAQRRTGRCPLPAAHYITLLLACFSLAPSAIAFGLAMYFARCRT